MMILQDESHDTVMTFQAPSLDLDELAGLW